MLVCVSFAILQFCYHLYACIVPVTMSHDSQTNVGHGIQIKEGFFERSDEVDGYDEAIVPLDYAEAGYIRDDELRKELVNGMASGVHMSVLFDCCHSGSMLDLPFKYAANDAERVAKVDVRGTFKLLGLMTRFSGPGSTTVIPMTNKTQISNTKRLSLETGKNSQLNDKTAQVVATAEMEQRRMTKVKNRLKPIDASVSLITACKDENYAIALPGDATRAFLMTLKDAFNQGEILIMVKFLLNMKKNLVKVGAHRVPLITSSREIDMYEEMRLIPKDNSGTKRALLIGINYNHAMTVETLKNCHKDCMEIKDFLHEYLGFWDKHCRVLMDDGVRDEPSRENILLAMKTLAEECESGDSVFFYFAGHGGSVKDILYGGDEDDLSDETIYPSDTDKSGVIKDDEIHDILVRGLTSGVSLTALMDCTHSGTLMDLPHRFNVHDEEVRKYIPATIRVISGRRDQGEDIGNHTGGLCTKAFLAALTLSGAGRSWDQLFTQMRSNMLHQLSQAINQRHPKQLPQLTSSRRIHAHDCAEMIPPQFNGTKRALFIGINYTGKGDLIEELDSCHMDVRKLQRYLQDVHGLRDDHCEVLMDDSKELSPTRENIINAMRRLVHRSKRGDFLFIHYCGHGGVDTSDGGFDECLVPIDFDTAGEIQEVDLQAEIVRPLVDGVTMTCLLDCCHSGSMLDLPFQFGIDGGHKKKQPRPKRASIAGLTNLAANSLMGKKTANGSRANLAAWCHALNLYDEELPKRRRRSSTKSTKSS